VTLDATSLKSIGAAVPEASTMEQTDVMLILTSNVVVLAAMAAKEKPVKAIMAAASRDFLSIMGISPGELESLSKAVKAIDVPTIRVNGYMRGHAALKPH
jgi:hypothetical protein